MKLEAGRALPVVSRRITGTVMFSRQYAGTNPVHTETAMAERQGMPAPVATGQISAAYIQEAFVQLLGEAMFRGSLMDVRFRRPVFLGDVLTTRGRIEEVRDEGAGRRVVISAACVNQDGVEVTVAHVEATVQAGVS